MEEWDMVTTRDGDEGEPVEGMEDCAAANGGNITDIFPVSPLKCRGVDASEQTKVLEEESSTVSMPTSPKSTVANTASADVEQASIDSAIVLEEGLFRSSVPALQNASVANTATADVQQANTVSDSILTVVGESSGSDSVPTLPKSSEPKTASAHVSQEANNDSDSVLTVVLEGESSGSDSVPTSPKSSVSSSASSDVVQQSNIDSALVLNEILQEEPSREDSVPTSQKSSESNTASADVTEQANKDAPLVLNEELEEKPSTSGSISIWEKSSVASTKSVALKEADVDPNNVHEGEVMSATEENRNEEFILNDKGLLAQSLIAKLMNLLLAKRLSELNPIQIKGNSRKRPSSAISVAAASEKCGNSTTDVLTRRTPPHTTKTGCINLMDYYISKQKKGGIDYDFSQLLTDNPGLVSELNFYTERMKSFIMLPIKRPNETEEIEESDASKLPEPTGKRAREEDKTNGAQNSKMTDLT